jgi:glycogen debranching enzyme
MDYIETVRDDADLATWTATGKAQNQEALDLNCYLLNEERTLAAMARELGREDDANSWDADADRRAELMRRHLWHEQDGVFYGRDLLTGNWAEVMDISTFLPLWCGLATPEQAARLVELLHDPQTFGTDYPVATLAVKHMPEKRKGEWHWRGSNWVEMSWLVVLGLKRYGFYAEAARVAEANCRMVFRTLEQSGHFREFYNTFTGEPTDLTDYIWASIPAAIAVDVFFGLRPTAEGLEILPALPKGWEQAAIKNLHVRNLRLAVHVRRDPAAKQTTVRVNGATRPAQENRGLTIPWPDLPPECRIGITHPPQ